MMGGYDYLIDSGRTPNCNKGGRRRGCDISLFRYNKEIYFRLSDVEDMGDTIFHPVVLRRHPMSWRKMQLNPHHQPLVYLLTRQRLGSGNIFGVELDRDKKWVVS